MSGTLMDNMCPVCGSYPCMCGILRAKGYIKIGSKNFDDAARTWAENNGWELKDEEV